MKMSFISINIGYNYFFILIRPPTTHREAAYVFNVKSILSTDGQTLIRERLLFLKSKTGQIINQF